MTEQKEKKLEDIRKEAEERNCPLQKSLYLVEEFLAGPMCGRCFPCSFGSYEARIRLKKLTSGEGSEEDILKVKRIAENMVPSSLCKKGKDTARFILEHIDTESFKEHSQGICSYKECLALVKYIIIPELCTMCGLCQDVCKYNAIIGERKKPYLSGYLPFEIAQPRCTKCGECIKVCPYGAIKLTSGIEEKETLILKS